MFFAALTGLIAEISFMKRRIAVLLPAVCLVMVAMSAKADTLTFDTNPSGTIIGPYSLTLGSSDSLSLFCMNDRNDIYAGESWGVNVVNGASFAGSAQGSVGFQFEEEAYIYGQYNGTNATDVQDALWTIFDPATPYTDANSSGLVAAAANFDYSNATFLSKTNFYLYDGKGTTPSESTPPQNFVGDAPVPEPSSLILFGSGLAGFAGLIRHRFNPK